jgi:hypothetical protein
MEKREEKGRGRRIGQGVALHPFSFIPRWARQKKHFRRNDTSPQFHVAVIRYDELKPR